MFNVRFNVILLEPAPENGNNGIIAKEIPKLEQLPFLLIAHCKDETNAAIAAGRLNKSYKAGAVGMLEWMQRANCEILKKGFFFDLAHA